MERPCFVQETNVNHHHFALIGTDRTTLVSARTTIVARYPVHQTALKKVKSFKKRLHLSPEKTLFF
jgi:hypothetical protein